MKAPQFWYPDEKATAAADLLPLLLSPLSYVFSAGTRLRRTFAKPYRSRVPVVCVGNIVAGGAGKTPTALTVARLLKERGEKPVFITRGYRSRQDKFGAQAVCVDVTKHTAADVGDEAMLLAGYAPTWVCRDRVAAIRQAEAYGTFIVLDDGFQNPFIRPTASLLVIDGEAGLGNERIIPAGPLRETIKQATTRASALIIIGEDKHKIAARTDLPVFHAHLNPCVPDGFPRKGRFVAFAGIGRPEKFYATVRAMDLDLAATVDFADHHVFTTSDIDMLRLTAEEHGARLLTTEKDAARLPADFLAETITLPVQLALDKHDAEAVLASLLYGASTLS